MSVYLDGGGAQFKVLAVAQSLTGGHHNGVTRVHTQGVEVLHITHCDYQEKQEQPK